MDRQVGSQRKRIGQGHEPIFEIWRRHFHDIELPDGATLVVTEKSEGGAESSSEGRAHFGRICADDGQLAVIDLQVLLQFIEAPHLLRAFRSPIAAVKAQDQRKAVRQLR